jgi:hypothetical protein
MAIGESHGDDLRKTVQKEIQTQEVMKTLGWLGAIQSAPEY